MVLAVDATIYSAFFQKYFRSRWKKQRLRLRKTLLFMHDNAPLPGGLALKMTI